MKNKRDHSMNKKSKPATNFYPCNCYEVVSAVKLEDLQRAVHDRICAGMMPLGGIGWGFLDPAQAPKSFTWTQAMCSPAVLVNTKLMDQLDEALSRCRSKSKTK